MDRVKSIFKIGNLELKSNLLLAPIAGYSDIGLRSLAMEYGAGLCYSEMISACGLCYDSDRTSELLKKADNEKPSAVQFFGGNPETIYKAVNSEHVYGYDLIDINMGCPVKKIFNNGAGSALMQDIKKAQNIVSAARGNCLGLPVTIKMRLGIHDDNIAIDYALAMEEAGVSAITVHGRTRDMMYSGKANLEKIKNIRKAIKITMIGNGDVVDKASMQAMFDTGVDAVMIGRGAIGRPYIFSELMGIPYHFNVKDAIYRHIELLRCVYPDKVVANNIKKHICFYGARQSYSKALREEINRSIDLEAVFKIVDKYFI